MSCDTDINPNVAVKLTVNGNDVKLNGFVQGFFANSILGMIKSLKDVEDVKTLTLEISK
ncbi:MAG: hypothetical protein JW912_00765 [Sedimentisphaerales bacterium]|nr:hypothetical protein [Sedimentisphaerales bacterium]